MSQFLPPLSNAEYEALKSDIAARQGIHTPVVIDVDTGEVLDGNHRMRACHELGIEPMVEPRSFPSEAHGQAFALAANLSRRQMSPEQHREMRKVQRHIYAELRKQGCTQAEAGGLVGAAQQTAADWESESFTGDGITFVDQRLTVPRDQRDSIYERAASGEALVNIAADYKVTPQRLGQIVKQVEARRNVPQPVVEGLAFPPGPFRCLTIDPPWPMPKIEREERPNQGATLDYPTLPVDCGTDDHQTQPLCCIAALPVPALADQRGAHIYLWVTHKFLPAGLDLFRTWDVRYQCVMTWRKNVGPTPFSWMYDTEHVLFGRVGDLPLLKNGLRLSFEAPVQGHSVKPDVFHERVTLATPEPRLELFARAGRDGFTAWGNEVSPVASAS